MDYRLPGLDGVQATAAVLRAAPDVAVVCLTASAGQREIESALEAGAVAFLTKDQGLDDDRRRAPAARPGGVPA